MSGSVRTALTTFLVSIGLIGPALAGVTVGESAPGFNLQDQKGDWHTLDEYAGKWVVLYFYPKDDTPGCTTEACAFRDNIFAFEDIGAIVLGISLDDVESHEEFAEKHSLPFSILADVDAQTATDYGVLKKLGTFKFAQRQSFIIDPSGNVARHYETVDPKAHTGEVLEDLQSLQAIS